MSTLTYPSVPQDVLDLWLMSAPCMFLSLIFCDPLYSPKTFFDVSSAVVRPQPVGGPYCTPERHSTHTTSVAVPDVKHFEQPSLSELSLFDPDSTNQSAEAFKDGFPAIKHQDISNEFDAITIMPLLSCPPTPRQCLFLSKFI